MKTTIEYSFIALPTNFIYIMDADTLKLFLILLNKHNFWASKGKLDNGYFIKSIEELARELDMKNIKDVRCTIQALVNAQLIEVIAEDGKRKTAKFKLNHERIEELGKENLFELKDSGYYIAKLKRTEQITYCVQNVDKLLTKCTPTIDKLDNINYLNNNNNNINNNNIILEKNNNIKKENNTSNILEEKIEEKKILNSDLIKKMKEASSFEDDAPCKLKRNKNYTMKFDIDDNPILDRYIMSRVEESSFFK